MATLKNNYLDVPMNHPHGMNVLQNVHNFRNIKSLNFFAQVVDIQLDELQKFASFTPLQYKIQRLLVLKCVP